MFLLESNDNVSVSTVGGGGSGGEMSSEIGLKREHVYIIIAAVIGASLILICLIVAFVVCYAFNKNSSKHRLNPIHYMPTNETSSTMQTLQTYNVSNPPDLWVGHSTTGPINAQLEVKQIEQDALRKSPADATNGQPNGNLNFTLSRKLFHLSELEIRRALGHLLEDYYCQDFPIQKPVKIH